MSNYTHPRDEYSLTDNTVVKTSAADNTGSTLFQVIVSNQGKDSAITTWTNYDKFIEEYGYPDYSTTGLTMYNAANWLKDGGILKTLRLTATDATKSNNLLMLHLNIVDTQKTNSSGDPLYMDAAGNEVTISTGNTPIMIKRAQVRLSFETFTNIASDSEDIKSLMRTKYSKDTDGYHFPLYSFVCKGRGSYGQKFRWRMVPNTAKDKEYSFRNYTLQILKNNEGSVSVVDGSTGINVSTYPSSKTISKISQYIPDVVKRNDYPVLCYAIDEYWDVITSLLLPVLQQEDPSITAQTIDYLTFYNKGTSSRYSYVDIDSTSIDLTLLTGHGLASGNDGNFATSNVDRWDNIYERMISAFRGEIDNTINDIKEHHITVAIDCELPIEVKRAMYEWRAKRDDFCLILDCCIQYTVAAVKEFVNDELSVDDKSTYINMHSFDTIDPYTGRIITVPATYIFAAELPSWIEAKGSQEPFAGVDLPLDDYIIEGSLTPRIADDDEKTELYNIRANYIEKENNSYLFGTNVTSQSVNSELSYLNNMFVYYEIKKALKSLSIQYRFKRTTTSADLSVLNKLASAKVEPFLDNKVKTISVEVVQVTTDELQKSVRTKCSVGFETFDLNNFIDVEINRVDTTE